MRKTLMEFLNEKIPISNESKELLVLSTVRLEVKKGHMLVKPSQLCNHIYYIEKGITRTFYYKDEKQSTDWVESEGKFTTIIDCFLSNKPSNKYLEVLEDSVLWSLESREFERLCSINNEIQYLARLVYHDTIICMQERFDDLHFISAQERYEKLMDKSADLLQRVPLSIIASYLGISQETLSRIRSKYQTAIQNVVE
jgi:CRP-like cAMP-binding protein